MFLLPLSYLVDQLKKLSSTNSVRTTPTLSDITAAKFKTKPSGAA